MAETPRSVQAAPLEIPVTIQGSRTVEGSDQRELFVESTKTTLVFDSGAVLSMKTKIAPGQCVFLRNEESGKEILCKVLESRQQGDSNYADLEFTVYEPDFWNGHKEGDESAEQKSEAQKKVEAAVANLTVNTKGESPAPVVEEAHTLLPEVEAPKHSEVPAVAVEESPEVKAQPKELATETGSSHTETKPEATSDGSAEAEAELAAMEPADAIADGSEAGNGSEPAPKKKKKQKPPRPPNFKARKITAAVSVTLAIAVISFQVYTWRGRIFRLKSKSPRFEEKLSKQPTGSAVANLASTPAAESTSATTGNSAQPAPATNATSVAGAAAVKAPSISAKPLASPTIPAELPKTARTHQPPASSTSKPAKISVPAEAELAPAKILSQPQPSMPPWAKKLDLDGVVKLDAVIDERGNIQETTAISGSPILRHAAEEAVALWIFQPATQDGKPVASHLVLTVEFQR